MFDLIIKALKALFGFVSKNEMTTTTSYWLYEPEMPKSMKD